MLPLLPVPVLADSSGTLRAPDMHGVLSLGRRERECKWECLLLVLPS